MRRIPIVLIALGLAASACGGGEAAPTTTPTAPATTTSPPGTTTTTAPTGPTLPETGTDLPPFEYAALAAMLDPFVGPMGYVTGRATLVDLGTYRATPEGTHLALYFTPTVDKTPDEYATELPLLARALVPAIFVRWPGLESLDFCQEPFDWQGGASPPGLTVFDIERATADAIDWTSADLALLLSVGGVEEGLDVYAQEEIQSSAVWAAAAGE